MKRLAFLLCALTLTCCGESREAEQRRLKEERLDDFYDREWVKCVNEIGIERCRLIQEVGMWKCRGYRPETQDRGIKSCAKQRFDDRYEQLPERKAEKEEAAKVVEEMTEPPKTEKETP